MTIAELRQRAAENLKKAEELDELAASEGRDLTPEESAEFDLLTASASEDLEKAARLEARAGRRDQLVAARRAAPATGGVVNVADLEVETRGNTFDRPTRAEIVSEAALGAPRRGDGPGRIPAAPVDRELEARGGFRNVGEFAMSVYRANPNLGDAHVIDQRLSPLAAATGAQQGRGADGGFLVPQQFAREIRDSVMGASTSLMGMADSYPVDGESITFNRNAESSRATGSRWGGVQSYWIAEADQITHSRPKFDQLKLEPQELATLVYVTNKLLRNASALSTYIGRAARDEIIFTVSDAIINGNGVGKPLGILNAACLVTVPDETSPAQSADTVVYANIRKMWSRMPANLRSGAVWFVNQDVEPGLESMAFDPAATAGTVPVYLPANISQAGFSTLYGRPVMPVEYCSTIGDLGDVILAHMPSYAVGFSSGGVDEAMSMHLRFDYAETAFRFMFDVDGQPWPKSAITPFKGSNTLSPFVAIATRS